MFAKSSNKVTFQDQQLDDYVLENSVLKSKLKSKTDALAIMSAELDKCSMDRDRCQLLVEQLRSNKSSFVQRRYDGNLYDLGQGDVFAKTSDQNCLLKLEVESLRSKLEDANEDIGALRKELNKTKALSSEANGNKRPCTDIPEQGYEQLVQQLEKVQKKYQQIQLDYRATLDEKEELCSDRDYYKNKVQRLNSQISYILSNRKPQTDNGEDVPKPIVDIDSIIMDNKYLQQRITQLEVEKEIIKRTLNKYKTLLENRNKNDKTMNLKRGFAGVMTQKQARELVDTNNRSGFKRASMVELNSLCLGLFEALDDKSIALQHQRKTNRILADRITELERTLESWCHGHKYIPDFPSEMLLEEFLPDFQDINKPCDSIHNTINTNKYDNDIEHERRDGENSLENVSNVTENGKITSKTVLPLELEELVKEALAELSMQPRS